MWSVPRLHTTQSKLELRAPTEKCARFTALPSAKSRSREVVVLRQAVEVAGLVVLTQRGGPLSAGRVTPSGRPPRRVAWAISWPKRGGTRLLSTVDAIVAGATTRKRARFSTLLRRPTVSRMKYQNKTGGEQAPAFVQSRLTQAYFDGTSYREYRALIEQS